LHILSAENRKKIGIGVNPWLLNAVIRFELSCIVKNGMGQRVERAKESFLTVLYQASKKYTYVIFLE
jgi:hypothetical protein